MIIFDIETGPLPESELRTLLPEFDESKVDGLVTGDFDPESVKTGNMKDPSKIQEKIESARAAHAAAKANANQVLAAAREKHWQDFVSKAALSAVTGRVLAIGYFASETGKFAIDDGKGDEANILLSFWHKYADCRKQSRKMVGHHSNQFDVPFIVRRSWILGIDVPTTVREYGRYLDPIFVDTEDIWSCGTRESVSLDRLSQALGTGRKPDGVDGSMFHTLWFGTESERAQAIEYLVNDLKLTAADAMRMGLI